MTDQPKLEDFTYRTYDKLRYGDTDRQGHVNNAVCHHLPGNRQG